MVYGGCLVKAGEGIEITYQHGMSGEHFGRGYEWDIDEIQLTFFWDKFLTGYTVTNNLTTAPV